VNDRIEQTNSLACPISFNFIVLKALFKALFKEPCSKPDSKEAFSQLANNTSERSYDGHLVPDSDNWTDYKKYNSTTRFGQQPK